MTRIHNHFNVSVSEIDRQDILDKSVIACSLVSNDRRSSEGYLAKLINFVEKNAGDFYLVDHTTHFL